MVSSYVQSYIQYELTVLKHNIVRWHQVNITVCCNFSSTALEFRIQTLYCVATLYHLPAYATLYHQFITKTQNI